MNRRNKKPKYDKLTLGCGAKIRKGYVNLDVVKLKGVDIVHDLNKVPWPFPDNSFKEIICEHILEHLNDFNQVISEIWRISKKGAILRVSAPYYIGWSAAADPSHKIIFCYRTFDYYATNPMKKSIEYRTDFGSKARFKILNIRINFSSSKVLNFIFNPLINCRPLIYERFFFFWFPATGIDYELEVVK
ncbi:MAG: methyltransferase domain-containing protein [Nanoarchaeota archaeon]